MSDPAWTEVPIRTAATQSNRETPVTSWDNLSKRNIDPNKCGLKMADLLAQVDEKENVHVLPSYDNEPDRICVVLNSRGKLGSVYSQIARSLSRRGGWKRKKSTKGRFHMVFGEAGGVGIPFKRFSQVFRYDYGIKPLVNYNRNCKTITNKVMMTQVLQKYARENNINDTFLPESFLFWPGRDDVSHRKEFESRVKALGSDSVWIVKPGNEAHGNGIFISDSVDQILDHIDSLPDGSSPWVVQRYISSPLLLEGNRKFDIRVWVLLTHDYKVFVHNEGVLRTSCCVFDMTDLGNKFVHMTNHSIQQEHKDFGSNEENNELFFDEFSKILQNDCVEFDEIIMPQIRDIVKHVFVAGKPILESIDEIDDYNSFMFFGFDMIIDSKHKVWLQEINATPAIADRLLGKISRDIIELAIDPVFPNSYTNSESKTECENGFSLVFKSEGKCTFVGNLPGPEANDEGVEIEQFGMDEGKTAKK